MELNPPQKDNRPNNFWKTKKFSQVTKIFFLVVCVALLIYKTSLFLFEFNKQKTNNIAGENLKPQVVSDIHQSLAPSLGGFVVNRVWQGIDYFVSGVKKNAIDSFANLMEKNQLGTIYKTTSNIGNGSGSGTVNSGLGGFWSSVFPLNSTTYKILGDSEVYNVTEGMKEVAKNNFHNIKNIDIYAQNGQLGNTIQNLQKTFEISDNAIVKDYSNHKTLLIPQDEIFPGVSKGQINTIRRPDLIDTQMQVDVREIPKFLDGKVNWVEWYNESGKKVGVGMLDEDRVALGAIAEAKWISKEGVDRVKQEFGSKLDKFNYLWDADIDAISMRGKNSQNVLEKTKSFLEAEIGDKDTSIRVAERVVGDIKTAVNSGLLHPEKEEMLRNIIPDLEDALLAKKNSTTTIPSAATTSSSVVAALPTVNLLNDNDTDSFYNSFLEEKEKIQTITQGNNVFTFDPTSGRVTQTDNNGQTKEIYSEWGKQGSEYSSEAAKSFAETQQPDGRSWWERTMPSWAGGKTPGESALDKNFPLSINERNEQQQQYLQDQIKNYKDSIIKTVPDEYKDFYNDYVKNNPGQPVAGLQRPDNYVSNLLKSSGIDSPELEKAIKDYDNATEQGLLLSAQNTRDSYLSLPETTGGQLGMATTFAPGIATGGFFSATAKMLGADKLVSGVFDYTGNKNLEEHRAKDSSQFQEFNKENNNLLELRTELLKHNLGGSSLSEEELKNLNEDIKASEKRRSDLMSEMRGNPSQSTNTEVAKTDSTPSVAEKSENSEVPQSNNETQLAQSISSSDPTSTPQSPSQPAISQSETVQPEPPSETTTPAQTLASLAPDSQPSVPTPSPEADAPVAAEHIPEVKLTGLEAGGFGDLLPNPVREFFGLSPQNVSLFTDNSNQKPADSLDPNYDPRSLWEKRPEIMGGISREDAIAKEIEQKYVEERQALEQAQNIQRAQSEAFKPSSEVASTNVPDESPLLGSKSYTINEKGQVVDGNGNPPLSALVQDQTASVTDDAGSPLIGKEVKATPEQMAKASEDFQKEMKIFDEENPDASKYNRLLKANDIIDQTNLDLDTKEILKNQVAEAYNVPDPKEPSGLNTNPQGDNILNADGTLFKGTDIYQPETVPGGDTIGKITDDIVGAEMKDSNVTPRNNDESMLLQNEKTSQKTPAITTMGLTGNDSNSANYFDDIENVTKDNPLFNADEYATNLAQKENYLRDLQDYRDNITDRLLGVDTKEGLIAEKIGYDFVAKTGFYEGEKLDEYSKDWTDREARKREDQINFLREELKNTKDEIAKVKDEITTGKETLQENGADPEEMMSLAREGNDLKPQKEEDLFKTYTDATREGFLKTADDLVTGIDSNNPASLNAFGEKVVEYFGVNPQDNTEEIKIVEKPVNTDEESPFALVGEDVVVSPQDEEQQTSKAPEEDITNSPLPGSNSYEAGQPFPGDKTTTAQNASDSLTDAPFSNKVTNTVPNDVTDNPLNNVEDVEIENELIAQSVKNFQEEMDQFQKDNINASSKEILEKSKEIINADSNLPQDYKDYLINSLPPESTQSGEISEDEYKLQNEMAQYMKDHPFASQGEIDTKTVKIIDNNPNLTSDEKSDWKDSVFARGEISENEYKFGNELDDFRKNNPDATEVEIEAEAERIVKADPGLATSEGGINEEGQSLLQTVYDEHDQLYQTGINNNPEGDNIVNDNGKPADSYSLNPDGEDPMLVPVETFPSNIEPNPIGETDVTPREVDTETTFGLLPLRSDDPIYTSGLQHVNNDNYNEDKIISEFDSKGNPNPDYIKDASQFKTPETNDPFSQIEQAKVVTDEEFDIAVKQQNPTLQGSDRSDGVSVKKGEDRAEGLEQQTINLDDYNPTGTDNSREPYDFSKNFGSETGNPGNGSQESPFNGWTNENIAKAFDYDEKTGELRLKDDWKKQIDLPGGEYYITPPSKAEIIDGLFEQNQIDSKTRDNLKEKNQEGELKLKASEDQDTYDPKNNQVDKRGDDDNTDDDTDEELESGEVLKTD